MIGYNCPQALAPHDFISGEGNMPFALKTVLGWSIVGITGAQDGHELCSISHKIMMAVADAKVVKDSDNSSHSQLYSDVPRSVPTLRDNKNSNTKKAATMYTTRHAIRRKTRPQQLEITAQSNNKRGVYNINLEVSASSFGANSKIRSTFMKCSLVELQTNSHSCYSKNRLPKYRINLDDQVYRGECKCTCR